MNTFNEMLLKNKEFYHLSDEEISKNSGVSLDRVKAIINGESPNASELMDLAIALKFDQNEITNLITNNKSDEVNLNFLKELIAEGNSKEIIILYRNNRLLNLNNNLYLMNNNTNSLTQITDDILEELYTLLLRDKYLFTVINMPRFAEILGYKKIVESDYLTNGDKNFLLYGNIARKPEKIYTRFIELPDRYFAYYANTNNEGRDSLLHGALKLFQRYLFYAKRTLNLINHKDEDPLEIADSYFVLRNNQTCCKKQMQRARNYAKKFAKA